MAESIEEAFTTDERAQEPWLMYDSIVIGRGAKDKVNSWFNTWGEFAKQVNKLEWFGKKRDGVPDWASNITGEREDFSLYFYQFGVELIAPMSGVAEQTASPDVAFMPMQFAYLLSTYMSLSMTQANTDVTLQLPTAHAPGGVGVDARRVDGAATPAAIPGSNGQLIISNSWHFAAERAIPRQGSWNVKGVIDEPAADFFKELGATAGGGPGFQQLVISDPGVVRNVLLPNWYVIRLWFRGKRNAQLRGAYKK